ncbi:PR domain zinc finger protein 5-like isoform X2 [Maniola hyperantus]|uniref:PR domain zinc finger protein 5-like isoform X2 n=1 Tax=Aphantopus hyperantus TaxID=2795564 RepID=UPI001568E8CD|nr:zinc finger protein draculin-like [Maniola hyperantus]
MANITVKRSKGPLVDPALCRCCHSIKKCRVLTSEYEFMGAKEVYSDMFMDIFGLLLSHLDGDNSECGICATCVCRLREAADFRKRVLQSEQMLLEARLRENDKNVKLEVKTEAACDSDARDPADDVTDDVADRNDDSEMDSRMDETRKMEHINNTQKSLKRTRNGHKVKGKQHLRTGKVQKLQRVDQLVKPESPAEKSQAKKQADALDQNRMALSNTVTIVNCSYVCPFHNRISFYYCFYCKDQFTNPSELREHTLSHDPTELFENSIENKKIPKIDITRIDCRLCPEKIYDLDTFKNHITTQHQKVLHPVANEFLKFKLTLNNLTCTECGSVFPYFDSLKKHMVDHFGTYTCDVCGACFLEHASLRTHIKKHNKVDANYPCEICGKNLKSKYSMGLHVATVHEKKPTVNCYKCDAAFLSYALRNRHLIEAHGDKRTFPCKLCDKVYNRRKTLIEHHRRNHLKIFNHQCDLCDQRFYLPSRLKEHMATHTGERNFRCEFCDKSYPRLQSLQEHVRSHSSDRRYKCDICQTTFTQCGSLKSHMKNHHNVFDLDASEGF